MSFHKKNPRNTLRRSLDAVAHSQSLSSDPRSPSIYFSRHALACAIALGLNAHLCAQSAPEHEALPAQLLTGRSTLVESKADAKVSQDVAKSDPVAPLAAAPVSAAATDAPILGAKVSVVSAAPNTARELPVGSADTAPNAVVRGQTSTTDGSSITGVKESAPAVANPASNVAGSVVESPDTSSATRGAESSANTIVYVSAPPTDLWDRIRAGYSMVDLEDDLVGKWEKYYADRPDYVARIVDRSSKYLFYIVTELERRDMPLEIALLPMIESAFNPIAHSSAKASGIWQFIPSTGTQFGMKQDWWADSRRDIVAATNGALDYLQKLHGMFGDWQLALASYNWGEGSVGRAVSRSKAAGRDGTYLTLNMPAETRNYLPKLQAVKNIIRDPARFGLVIASVPNEPYFKTVTLAHAIDLKKAAQFADMSEAEFVALNPAHHRPVIAGRNEFQILLPAAKADLFISRLETYENPKVSWRAYKTRAGDRIDAIAQRFGTSVAALKSVNGIRTAGATLPAGYHLLVPSDGPSDDALGSLQNAVFTKFPESTAPRAHRVRKGETFAGIAKRYGIAPATLAKWNRMGKQSARAGQLLYVSGPAPTRSQAKTVRASSKSGAAGKRVASKAVGKKSVKGVKRAPAKKRR